jgi:hypothetical protein
VCGQFCREAKTLPRKSRMERKKKLQSRNWKKTVFRAGPARIVPGNTESKKARKE